MTTDSTPAETAGGEIVAKAGRYYRNTRYLMFAMLVGMGCWFLYDGFVKYPRENAELDQLETERTAATSDTEKQRISSLIAQKHRHSPTDLMIQKALGFSLPPLGIALLWWAFHRSRGEYRLSGTKLSVPGHPTIDMDDIKSVNNDLWDRKGIVWLKYETPQGQAGEITLDDFIYDRPPTDAIYDRIADRFGLSKDDEDEEDDEADADEEERSKTESSDAQR